MREDRRLSCVIVLNHREIGFWWNIIHFSTIHKNEGIWLDHNEFNQKYPYLTEGQEAKVYRDTEPGYVLKSIDYDYGKHGISPAEFLDNKVSLFNHLFPATKYEMVGMMRDGEGRFRFVLKQPFIEGEAVHPSQRKAYIKKLLGADSEALTPEQYTNSDYHL